MSSGNTQELQSLNHSPVKEYRVTRDGKIETRLLDCGFEQESEWQEVSPEQLSNQISEEINSKGLWSWAARCFSMSVADCMGFSQILFTLIACPQSHGANSRLNHLVRHSSVAIRRKSRDSPRPILQTISSRTATLTWCRPCPSFQP